MTRSHELDLKIIAHHIGNDPVIRQITIGECQSVRTLVIHRTFGTGSCSCLRSPEAVHIYRFVIIRIVELNICKAPLLILTRAIVCGHRRDTAYRQNKNKRQQKCQSPEMLHSHSPFYDILRLQVSNSPVVLCHRL